jgi:Fe-S cluster biogenesis protein NfuA/nitrite reductase/ring-hydroxylating ferredoxin subunit
MDTRPEVVEGREPAAVDFRATGERINALLDASASGGALARERAEELVRLVAELYGAGLARILDILYDSGRLDDDVLADLACDDLVSGLLLVHDLHPYDVVTRVERALDGVRPYLGSHGGDVELIEVADDVVRLRLLGSCDGCPSSSVTLELAVEQAIQTAAPEITGIEVETPPSAAGVIAAESLWSRVDGHGSLRQAQGTSAAWIPVPGLAELADGAVQGFRVGETEIIGCRAGKDLYAFRDRCASCDTSLATATLGRLIGGRAGDAALRCPRCGSHFAVRQAGAGLEQPGLHLDPVPLLVDAGTATVALPTPVPA